MKKLLPSLFFLFLIASCSKWDETDTSFQDQLPVLRLKDHVEPQPSGMPLSKKEIDAQIKLSMDKINNFSWENASLTMIWSAAQYGDQALAVGYCPAGITNTDDIIHQVNVKTGIWKSVHDALVAYITTELSESDPQFSFNEILIEDDPVLPVITLRLTDKKLITSLYNLKNVRYIEPSGYWPESDQYKIMALSGCSGSSLAVNTADYTTIPPGCLLPWNYNNCNIPAAWNVAQGAGIRIGVIDAGLSATQSLLGASFQSGYSAGSRTLSVDYTYGAGVYNSCTHGTSMSGLAAGPRNSSNAITGVAYMSDLYFIRGCEDVVLDQTAEKTGVKNALVKMGDNAATRIISMSVGYPFASSLLKDGVTYAYNKGKMIFAAAGTSFSWTSWWGVVYPAAYSQCIAITGVKENGNTCATCHSGSQVRFTVPMERDVNSDRNSLSLPLTGTSPSYIGGSSAATATAAGIAALVWSAKPSLTRTQVYDCLKNTSQFYPNLNSGKGYGNLNAGAAVNLALTM